MVQFCLLRPVPKIINTPGFNSNVVRIFLYLTVIIAERQIRARLYGC